MPNKLEGLPASLAQPTTLPDTTQHHSHNPHHPTQLVQLANITRHNLHRYPTQLSYNNGLVVVAQASRVSLGRYSDPDPLDTGHVAPLYGPNQSGGQSAAFVVLLLTDFQALLPVHGDVGQKGRERVVGQLVLRQRPEPFQDIRAHKPGLALDPRAGRDASDVSASSEPRVGLKQETPVTSGSKVNHSGSLKTKFLT